MSTEMIITLIVFGVVLLAFAGVLIYALVKGNLKEFVLEKMAEAEATKKEGGEKLKYVLDAVKEKYKFGLFITVANKIVELAIKISKEINYKK